LFLNPEWATNAVYKVTDDEDIQAAFGTFEFDDLAAIWSDPAEFPPEKHVELVELMKSFELCFELPQGGNYIIPELLRANQPNFEWDDADNLRFQYRYSFIPAGVMTRFIVVIHDLIKKNLYWKDGVVLRWEQTEAVVIKTGPRLVEMWVRGNDRKTLLGIVRRQMAHIHSPFSNLEVNEMVPCICTECAENDDPYFHPYKNLLKAREKGTRDIQCQKSFEGVSIEKLLGGIEDRTPRTEKEHKVWAMRHQPRDIKIFLASSGELKAEREAIELFIGKENRRLRVDNTFLDLVIWEDLKQSFHGERIQDYFNEEMLKCDVVICLFFKKVGEFTKEEFELADENRKQGNKPRYLYVYFKSAPVDIGEIEPEELLKIKALKEEIEQKQQIYNQYTSIDNLTSQIKRQLEQIIPKIEQS